MLDELKKIIIEMKKINKKINKSYKWIIISIITLALGFMLPGFLVSEVAFLGDLAKLIDGLYMLITGDKAVITPIIYIGISAIGTIGTVLNTIKLGIRKIKLKEIEKEEKEKIKEIESQIKELSNDSNLTKEELDEVKETTKEILMDIKNDVLNTARVIEEENLVNNEEPTNNLIGLEKDTINQDKVMGRKKG